MDLRIEKSKKVLNYIISDLGLDNPKQLSEKLGFDRPERLYKILRGDVSISRKLASKINEIYPQYDKDAILTGSMLNLDKSEVNENQEDYKLIKKDANEQKKKLLEENYKDKYIEVLEENRELKNELIAYLKKTEI